MSRSWSSSGGSTSIQPASWKLPPQSWETQISLQNKAIFHTFHHHFGGFFGRFVRSLWNWPRSIAVNFPKPKLCRFFGEGDSLTQKNPLGAVFEDNPTSESWRRGGLYMKYIYIYFIILIYTSNLRFCEQSQSYQIRTSIYPWGETPTQKQNQIIPPTWLEKTLMKHLFDTLPETDIAHENPHLSS